MWTMPRVISALLYGALGYYASQLIIPHFQLEFEGRAVGMFAEYNAFFCMIVGWKVAGTRAGQGWGASISYGLTTGIFMTVISLFFHSFGEMIRKALDRDYGDQVVEAVVDVFQLMIKFGQVMVKPDVMIALLGGGIICGLIVEWSGRRYR